MKSAALESVKFKKLKRRLNLPHWQAVGLLEALWQFTCANAPQGDIGRHSNEDICASLEWGGDADELIKTLTECGWLDIHEECRLSVHDWHEHAPNYVKGGLAKAGKSFIAKDEAKLQAKDEAKLQAKDEAKLQAKDEAKHIPTKSNQAKPNQTKPLDHEEEIKGQGLNFLILHKPETARKVKLESFADFAKHDVTSIACTICNEFSGPGMGAFSKWLKSLAKDSSDFEATSLAREELFKFWSELKAGEEPKSRAAALLARCRKIFDDRKTGGK
ncbi:MAG: hypothetical protein WCH86_02290 [Kiritimatiellales bacterium]